MKPKIAFFDFASCEGCQLAVLELEDELLDLLGLVEIVNFREAIDDRRDDYEIAFLEGSITRPADLPRVQKIRETAKICVAMGACATTGGVNAIKNLQPDLEEARRYVYGEKAACFDTFATQPMKQVIKVDYELYGCPINKYEFLELVKYLLAGRTFRNKSYPLCVECKLNGNICVFHKGMTCLGPVTRAGCNSICPNNGNKCEGCRGLVDDPNTETAREVLAEHGYSVEDILREFTLFNAISEATRK